MSESKSLLFDEAFLRRLEQLSLIYRSASRSQLQGERRSLGRGGSVEFADFRPYTLGDDFRRIDWNAYARLERLFIKLFMEEQQVSLHLLVDNSLSMDWGSPNKLDLARRASAAVGYIGLLGLDRVHYSSLLPGGKDAPGNLSLRGKQSALKLFSAAQSILPSASTEPASARLTAILSQVNRPGMFVLFSDLLDPSWKKALSLLLGQGHQCSLIHILAPDEISPDLDGEFRLLDRETGDPVEITADYETLSRYIAHRQDWQAAWAQFCLHRRAAYLPISSAVPLEDLLFSQLPRLGVLK